MDIFYPQLPEKDLIYAYLVKNRASYTYVSLSESEYKIVRSLREFVHPISEEDDGRIAQLIIIVE